MSPDATSAALDPSSGRPIRCAACEAMVTRAAARITRAGAHRHAFFNPMGLVFEIGCFAVAPGCRCVGPASREFSWFAGHAWRVGLCAACKAHLGWRFEAESGGAFFGLVLDRLQEGDED